MKRQNIEEVARIDSQIKALEFARKEWANVDLTTDEVPRLYNAIRVQLPSPLPRLADDPEMHSMLVQSIVAEYDSRIRRLIDDLIDLGVEIVSSH
jgi:hypothetical protein